MIEVEVFTLLSSGQKKSLFCKEVKLPDGLYFPYETLTSNLRLLFGNNVFISFIDIPL